MADNILTRLESLSLNDDVEKQQNWIRGYALQGTIFYVKMDT